MAASRCLPSCCPDILLPQADSRMILLSFHSDNVWPHCLRGRAKIYFSADFPADQDDMKDGQYWLVLSSGWMPIISSQIPHATLPQLCHRVSPCSPPSLISHERHSCSHIIDVLPPPDPGCIYSISDEDFLTKKNDVQKAHHLDSMMDYVRKIKSSRSRAQTYLKKLCQQTM